MLRAWVVAFVVIVRAFAPDERRTRRGRACPGSKRSLPQRVRSPICRPLRKQRRQLSHPPWSQSSHRRSLQSSRLPAHPGGRQRPTRQPLPSHRAGTRNADDPHGLRDVGLSARGPFRIHGKIRGLAVDTDRTAIYRNCKALVEEVLPLSTEAEFRDPRIGNGDVRRMDSPEGTLGVSTVNYVLIDGRSSSRNWICT